jgi:hypothetical protein
MLWRWRTGRELLPAHSTEDAAAADAAGRASGSPGRTRSIWDELDAEVSRAERDGAERGADNTSDKPDNVTSLADHWSTGGTRGEGGR